MKTILFVLVTVLTLTACGNGGESTGFYDANGNMISEFRIAMLIDENNPEAGRASAIFRESLSEVIGIPVTEVEGISHLIGLEAMRGGSLDMMLGSGFTFLTAESFMDVEFLAMLYNPNASNANSLFLVGANQTHINSLADLENESFAFVDTASQSGFLFPMYELVSTLGLDHNQMLNPGYFFSDTLLTGNHDASAMAVANGNVAGAVVVDVMLDHLVDNGIIDANSFRVIHSVEILASAGYFVPSTLPQELIDMVRTFLLEFDDEDFFATTQGNPNVRFVPHDPAELLPIRSLTQRLEIGQ